MYSLHPVLSDQPFAEKNGWKMYIIIVYNFKKKSNFASAHCRYNSQLWMQVWPKVSIICMVLESRLSTTSFLSAYPNSTLRYMVFVRHF